MLVLKENFSLFRRLALFVDILIIFLSFVIASMLQFQIDDYYTASEYIQLFMVILPIWALLLYFFGMYNSFRTKDITDIIYIVSKTALAGFILYGSFHYVLKMPYFSRSFVSLIFLVTGYALCLEKIVLLFFLKAIYRKGLNSRNILIVGTGPRAEKFIDLIQKHAEWGIKVIGLVDQDKGKKGQTIHGHKVLGTFDDMPDIIQNNVIDEVAFVVPRSWLDKIEEIIHFCENRGIRVYVALDIFNPALSIVRQTDIDGFPLLTFESVPYRVSYFLLKRIFDIAAGMAVLTLFSPLILMTGLVLKLMDNSQPVFVRRQRVGLNGRRYWLYKFRTDEKETDEEFFALPKDIRAKSKGINKILRLFHIDDLPQFWNVIKGDMSIIGPRAATPPEIERYQPWQKRKLSMRPGVICLWFLRPPDEIADFEERIRLDLRYVDNWSPWLDFRILVKVVPILFGLRIFKESYA